MKYSLFQRREGRKSDLYGGLTSKETFKIKKKLEYRVFRFQRANLRAGLAPYPDFPTKQKREVLAFPDCLSASDEFLLIQKRLTEMFIKSNLPWISLDCRRCQSLAGHLD